ncbi:hypothetical protein F4805DRAFT_474625 [Annulohypoxylon moriforme]|nr:hypothetical protein F4805DRAFT_474625 [Annulohypoxylon moriforme]
MSSLASSEESFVNLSKESLPPKAILLVTPITIFYTLAIICIGLRLWAKRIKKTPFRFCDFAILIAAVFATGYFAICWLAVDRGGVGFPFVQVAPAQRIFTQKLFFAGWLVQTWTNSFVRLSVLDFIAHVFFVKKFRIVVHIFEACTVSYLIACTIAFFTVCRPMKYNWGIGSTALEHCGDLNLKFLLSAIFNLVLDMSILVLPMPMLWTLRLNSSKKVALMFVFSLGIFVCFATAWRTYIVVKFSTPEAKLNFTITVMQDALWSGLEINLGIINACLPIIPPALQRLVKVPFLSFSTSHLAKPSNLSSTGANGASEILGRRLPWMRLDSQKSEDRTVSLEMYHDYRAAANRQHDGREPPLPSRGLPKLPKPETWIYRSS